MCPSKVTLFTKKTTPNIYIDPTLDPEQTTSRPYLDAGIAVFFKRKTSSCSNVNSLKLVGLFNFNELNFFCDLFVTPI